MGALILLIDPDRYQGERYQRLLEARGHRVLSASLFGAGLTMMCNRAVDVVLLDWATVPRDVTDIQVRLRQIAPQANPFVIAMVAAGAADPLRVLERGADDLLRHPASCEDLIARVEAPTRYRSFVDRARAAGPVDWVRSQDPARVPGWDDVGALAAKPLGELLSRRVKVSTTRSSQAVPSAWSELLLSAPAEGLAIRVLLRADLGTLKKVSQGLLGNATPGPGDVEDVLGEINNTISGALRHAAAGMKVSMTAGLPRALAPTEVPANEPGHVLRRSFEIEGISGSFELLLSCLSDEVASVPAGRLEEGMVVAQDIFGASGALLVAAGTRITTSTAERLTRALGGQFNVRVAPFTYRPHGGLPSVTSARR